MRDYHEYIQTNREDRLTKAFSIVSYDEIPHIKETICVLSDAAKI